MLNTRCKTSTHPCLIGPKYQRNKTWLMYPYGRWMEMYPYITCHFWFAYYGIGFIAIGVESHMLLSKLSDNNKHRLKKSTISPDYSNQFVIDRAHTTGVL